MQTLIVIIIVALAAVYLVKTLFAGPKDEGNCSCGCSSCPSSSSCDISEHPPD